MSSLSIKVRTGRKEHNELDARIRCNLHNVEQLSEPGTIDHLIADAAEHGHQVIARLVRDWSERGLLDYPTRRPAGKGHGSKQALYTANQRMLFLALLDKRADNGIRSLARMPVWLWMYWGDDYVPLRQARRAFMTWLGDPGSRSRPARERAQAIWVNSIIRSRPRRHVGNWSTS